MQATEFWLYWKYKINLIIINTDLFVLLQHRHYHKDWEWNLKPTETGESIYHFEDLKNHLQIQIL